MRPLRALLLLAAASAPLSGAEMRWDLGQAEVRLVEAGYVRDSKHQAWEAELELRVRNKDLQRRFSRNVRVEFVAADGRSAHWQSFVNLAPGSAQHRRLRAPQRLGCAGALADCPGLQVRVSLKAGDAKAALAPLPPTELAEPEAPPADTPLWVARVYDGDTFELVGGAKVRLLGVDTPERLRKDGAKGAEAGSKAASDFSRERLMAAPVRLAYDGERQDVYGRWLAQVTLADGQDLNAELLRRGLARVYARSEASRLEAYRAIEAQAREKGLGLWKAAKE